MLSYILPIYQNDEYTQNIFQANGKEMDDLWNAVHEMRKQVFPQKATWTLSYWEHLLGIDHKSKLSESERRKHIIMELNKYFPVTKERIQKIASVYVSDGHVEVIESYNEYKIIIRFVLQGNILPSYEDVMTVLGDIIPAHLSLDHEAEKILTPSSLTFDTQYCAVKYPYFMCGTFHCGTKPYHEFSPRKLQVYFQLETKNGVHQSIVPLTGLFKAGEGGERP